MKFLVPSVTWAGDSPDPKDILNKFCSSEIISSNYDGFYLINISSQELMQLSSSNDFDILITKSSHSEFKMLAFDSPGKRFKQR